MRLTPGLLAACGLAALALASPAQAAEKTYNLGPVKAIEASGVLKLLVTVGAKQSIVVEEPNGNFDHIDLSVDDGELEIETEWNRRDDGERPKYTVKMTIVSLDELDLSGAIDSNITGINGDALNVDLSGAVEVAMAGKCGKLDADISGAAKFDAHALQCKAVDLDLSGAGKASVYASESANVDVSGAAKVEIHGHPKNVNQDISGAAKINIVGK